MNEEKLLRYIKGEILSDVEIIEILDWIESSPENQKKYTLLKNLWVVTGIDHHDLIEVPDFSFREAKLVQFRPHLMASFMKYAAVFVLAFFLGSVSFLLINSKEHKALSMKFNTIKVPNGQRSQITLYDGTKVWLNSGTTFRYPVLFSSKSREVIIEGEAFFDVAKDKEHPFILNAGNLSVEVLGTHFDVCAYPEENELSTTLVEGSVNVLNTTTGKRVILKPGEQVVLNRLTNGLEINAVNTDLYTSWKENLLKFDNATFEEVIKKMERWYDVKIFVASGIDTKDRYTMKIKTESLREMLQLVAKTTKIKYEIKESTVFIK
ncbi:MAG: FecR domain-containing protein [Prolixibacteraceae bacterium]